MITIVRRIIQHPLPTALALLVVFGLTSTFTVFAQNQPEIENLLVEVWPEYDRTETLVIYRVELSADTILPATVTFRLPGYIEAMNAVAFEQNGMLLAVDEETIERSDEDDVFFLTFPTPTRTIQLEYYDPVIFSKEGESRQIDFQFVASYEIESASFEFQEPAGTEAFSLNPEPSRSFTDSNGLKYNLVDVSGLVPGDKLHVIATYQRSTDSVTTELLGLAPAPAQPVPESSSIPMIIAYGLVGMGMLLLLGAAGMWWLNKKKTNPINRRVERQPSSRKRWSRQSLDRNRAVRLQETSSTNGYCPTCGTELRTKSNFCHRCGAKRR